MRMAVSFLVAVLVVMGVSCVGMGKKRSHFTFFAACDPSGLEMAIDIPGKPHYVVEEGTRTSLFHPTPSQASVIAQALVGDGKEQWISQQLSSTPMFGEKRASLGPQNFRLVTEASWKRNRLRDVRISACSKEPPRFATMENGERILLFGLKQAEELYADLCKQGVKPADAGKVISGFPMVEKESRSCDRCYAVADVSIFPDCDDYDYAVVCRACF